MVAAMDEAVGQVVEAIERKGLRPNTLFVFSSDNGGPAPGRVTSNGPLHGQKATVYEGGVRVPAFATWEGRIKPGSVVDAPLHMVDWYPTLLTLAGASLAQPLPLDGRDAWPAITQGATTPHDVILLNATPTSGGLRAGDWKLVLNRGDVRDDADDEAAPPKSQDRHIVELFNLATDPYEKQNLAADHPEKVKELRARYEGLARESAPPRSRPRPAGFQAPKVWGEVN
jgi:arylsulfatase A-like enzyme